MHKTNAMRMLDARGVAYTPFAYPPTIHSGEEVAHQLGEDPGRVFKTLVVVADAEWMLVMAPSDRELDLKRCAVAVGAKRVRMATRKEAEGKTGLLAGGISPLALLQKPFRVFLDHQALNWDAIWLSAGQRGYNLRIAVADLVAVSGARVIDAVGLPPETGGEPDAMA